MRWAVSQLELELSEQTGNARLIVPESDRSQFDGNESLTLALNNSANQAAESIAFDGRLSQWLFGKLREADSIASVRPVDQPTAVNDITQKLFESYTVEGGKVHLGGCQLTDFPFLRLSFIATEQNELCHVFVAHDGSSVSDELAQQLGLLDVEPILNLPPRIDETALQSLLTAGRRVAAQSVTSRDPNATAVEPAIVSVVWVKHADGQLNFTIGDTTVSQLFSGWAKLLEAKPYTSPASGASSFELAATDDGRIDTHDQIAVCQQSGQRVLLQELISCGVTGKLVLEAFTSTCPVTGKPCLSEAFVVCKKCRQKVSKAACENDHCKACQSLAKIPKDDPRLVWILGEYKGLDRWNTWQLAETKTVYIAQAGSWTKRLLAVFDKESLVVHHLATSGKLSSLWTPAADPMSSELLK